MEAICAEIVIVNEGGEGSGRSFCDKGEELMEES